MIHIETYNKCGRYADTLTQPELGTDKDRGSLHSREGLGLYTILELSKIR